MIRFALAAGSASPIRLILLLGTGLLGGCLAAVAPVDDAGGQAPLLDGGDEEAPDLGPADSSPADAGPCGAPCPRPTRCADGVCVPVCVQDQDCLGPCRRCDAETGLCTEFHPCRADADCDAGSWCNLAGCGACQEGCRSGDDCPWETPLCSDHRCVGLDLPGCDEQSADLTQHCPPGWHCLERSCVPERAGCSHQPSLGMFFSTNVAGSPEYYSEWRFHGAVQVTSHEIRGRTGRMVLEAADGESFPEGLLGEELALEYLLPEPESLPWQPGQLLQLEVTVFQHWFVDESVRLSDGLTEVRYFSAESNSDSPRECPVLRLQCADRVYAQRRFDDLFGDGTGAAVAGQGEHQRLVEETRTADLYVGQFYRTVGPHRCTDQPQGWVETLLVTRTSPDPGADR